jgi:hypothetical protein
MRSATMRRVSQRIARYLVAGSRTVGSDWKRPLAFATSTRKARLRRGQGQRAQTATFSRHCRFRNDQSVEADAGPLGRVRGLVRAQRRVTPKCAFLDMP